MDACYGMSTFTLCLRDINHEKVLASLAFLSGLRTGLVLAADRF